MYFHFKNAKNINFAPQKQFEVFVSTIYFARSMLNKAELKGITVTFKTCFKK